MRTSRRLAAGAVIFLLGAAADRRPDEAVLEATQGALRLLLRRQLGYRRLLGGALACRRCRRGRRRWSSGLGDGARQRSKEERSEKENLPRAEGCAARRLGHATSGDSRR